MLFSIYFIWKYPFSTFLFHYRPLDALGFYDSFDFSHRDADTDSVNTMVVHEDEGEAAEGEQAGGYGDQTMLVQRVSHPFRNDA